MYIVINENKQQIGFKGLELVDVFIGLTLIMSLLILSSFESLRYISLILLVISVFMFLPINLSQKNRMYKIIYLVFKYLKKDKIFIYQSIEIKGEND